MRGLLTRMRTFWHGLRRPAQLDADMNDEMRFHIEMETQRWRSRGFDPQEAARQAAIAFGGVDQHRAAARDALGFTWLRGISLDVTLGARMLRKSPGLTVVAVIALAVAFGAGATYLEFVNGLVRPPLSFAGGDRLVGIVSRDIEKNTAERRVLRDFRVWRDRLRLIEQLGAAQDITGDVISDDGRADPADGVRISAWAFRLVPASPLLGRPLVDADEDAAAVPVAVIGEALWQSRFNRDPLIVGRAVTIGSVRYAIVGVMPKAFGFPVNQNLWVPFRDGGAALRRGEGPPIAVFGRLAPGATIEAAQAELAAVTARTAAADPATAVPLRTDVKPYVESVIDAALDFNGQILALYAANLVFVALLGLCAANVATLVFGRTVTREAEITVRTALGASRGRVVSQLIAEAMVLASLGAVVGLAAASLSLPWVRRAWETGQGSAMPFWWDERLSAVTMLYTALLVVVAALIVGGIPGFKATGPALQGRLKSAGGSSTMRFGKLWTSIIVTQVAITVIFLLSVVSLAWSIVTIEQQYQNVAFQRSEYLTATLAPDDDAVPADAAAIARTRDDFVRRLMETPAVASATYTTRLPGGDQETSYFEFEGATLPTRVAHVGPGFFETFGRDVIAGRGFTAREIESGANVAVADESFVRYVLGGRAAVGQQVREAPDREKGEPGPWIQIVGVTRDMSTAARKSIKDGRLYRPVGALAPGPVTLVVHVRPEYRVDGLARAAAAVRGTASAMPAHPRVSAARAMDAAGGGDVIAYVFAALGTVAAVALLLSTAGIYALISFTLARRTREIGIRTALGASPRRIVTAILSKALLQIAIGVAAGVLPGAAIVHSVATASGRNGLVDGIAVAAAVAAFVLTIAAAACSVPLRRALRIEPTDALRVT
jgi:putative ABC transport system permease protein